jgi:hypothetical protein
MKRARKEEPTSTPTLLFSTHPIERPFKVTTLDKDASNYALTFTPPLTRAQAAATSVRASVGGAILFEQPILPGNGMRVTLMADVLEYEAFDTHAVQLVQGSEHQPHHIQRFYLGVDNNAVEPDPATGQLMLLQPSVSMRAFLSEATGARFHGLSWFPPDVDPAQYGCKRFDTRIVPQRSPLWFKLRGDVSGSKAYVLLGFWVPTRAEDPTYNFFAPAPTPSVFAQSAMRLGALMEDRHVLMYLGAFPERHLYEVGWCPAGAGYPVGWGASPDARVVDNAVTMGWDDPQIPAHIRAQWEQQHEKGIIIEPPTHGACEFKTSRSKTDMEAYFYAQIYMEMIALRVVWCDLVRYNCYQERAHVYRIWRDRDVETRLVALWKRAHAKAHALQDLVHGDAAFREMRARFYKDAREAQPYRVIECEGAGSGAGLWDAYEAHRAHLMKPT